MHRVHKMNTRLRWESGRNVMQQRELRRDKLVESFFRAMHESERRSSECAAGSWGVSGLGVTIHACTATVGLAPAEA